ncbi:MAG: thioredoxin family protein [Deltaproteobacteria bacterium]|nr:thioredoxin family protein [Deltaproteobacteria bacterium]
MTKTTVCLVSCALMIVLGASGAFVDAAEPQINLQALAAKKMPVLLEFGRGWCIPCKYMKPILEDMAKVYGGRAIVTTVDMDANKDLVRQFRIRMMPTQVFLTPDGKEFLRNEGTLEREQIMKIFAQMGLPAPGAQGPTRAAAPPQTPVRQ